ncbi:PhnA domain-containing protein [Marinicella meishanensis]|uniref:PhnA domain-containing protein n=1 Tax=Marinicella meishanensis TaxID=2873263 RepID=UPI001CBAC500|nr:alkylphosphonate utilization protein [Marinicella sp. NBU2979]
MNLTAPLTDRSGGCCEMCQSTTDLQVYAVPPVTHPEVDTCAYLCTTCRQQIDDPAVTEPNHWRCLNECMWSEVPAIKVLSWRLLTRLSAEGWPRDLLDMLYLDDELLQWAQATGEGQEQVKHTDCHGSELLAGDTVTLIKDLKVKGGGFTAKQGTAVRNIALVPDNRKQIEGKVESQRIVITTDFVKKSH